MGSEVGKSYGMCWEVGVYSDLDTWELCDLLTLFSWTDAWPLSNPGLDSLQEVNCSQTPHSISIIWELIGNAKSQTYWIRNSGGGVRPSVI